MRDGNDLSHLFPCYGISAHLLGLGREIFEYRQFAEDDVVVRDAFDARRNFSSAFPQTADPVMWIRTLPFALLQNVP